MNEAKWATFFELLNEIVNNIPGTYGDRKNTTELAAQTYGEKAETNLEEFLSWWDGDYDA